MYHGCKTMCKEIGDDDVIDDIIKSKGRSTFWTAVTLLIFKLKLRTNAQMWGIGLAIWMLYWFQNLLNHYSCRHYFTSYHHFGNFGKYAIAHCFLLAKIFNFGKYVRLTVCYLPKFSILTSMFVWRFVCLSVCLSVQIKVVSRIQATSFDQSSSNLTQMCNLVMARNPFIT